MKPLADLWDRGKALIYEGCLSPTVFGKFLRMGAPMRPLDPGGGIRTPDTDARERTRSCQEIAFLTVPRLATVATVDGRPLQILEPGGRGCL